jgi:peptide/nickel transport system substrate-binding protein
VIRKRHSRTIYRPILAGIFGLSIVLTPMLGLGSHATPAVAASPRYLTSFVNYAAAFQRNFNPFMSTSRLDFTQGGVYEPLMIVTTAGKGHIYPWLATKLKWTNHNRTAVVTLRSGVRWSDGKPFTAADVAFTFNYGKRYAAADETGLMQSHQIVKVQQLNKYQVAFTFKTVNTTVLPQLLSTNDMIVPQHIWSKITNPGTFANPNPVGTGPFARVARFTSQEYILGKNKYYWQKGKPTFDGIRVPALSGNDAALASAIKGDIDWQGTKIANVQSSYINHDLTHFHAYYGNLQYPLGLYVNDQKYPYSLYPLREAMSLAIDRNKINKIAEAGYEPPADALAMSKLYPAWVDPKLKAQAKALAPTTPNVARAKQVLTKAGFTYKGSDLYDPKGNRVSLALSCPTGWDDWVTTMQIIEQNLQAIGIDASFQAADATAWLGQRSHRLLDGFLWSPLGGINPYIQFNAYMSKDSYFPQGQDALASGLANLSGWYSPKATTLLAQWRQTASVKKQKLIAYQLERIQLNNLPFIPTVYAPYWYDYSTLHFTGFPNKQNNYANGATYVYPDDVKVLTTIRPVK